ncbi:hypothetical protein [Roseofilum casamattae]|uniref:Uncharacterized protein n=1 Tax=Roseofilum casamattae BLCC-M143 TaxID=3022442 RepID=A0ABT7BYS4_9CYAN|nr:hypothetical protein [Roseofilum casamattae]MDJ1183428.1 hypothetical protein [Roseofilum casamattae BLCC-M143]
MEVRSRSSLIVVQAFGLTLSQTQLMYSFEYHLVLTDLQMESNTEKKRLKLTWLEEWQDSINRILDDRKDGDRLTDIDSRIVTNFEELKLKVRRQIQETEHRFSFNLILLESTLFAPYYAIFGDSRDERFKGLEWRDRKLIQDKVRSYAQLLKFDSACIDRFQTHHKEAQQGIKGGFNPWI